MISNLIFFISISYLYFIMQGTQDVKFFSKPNCLTRLARFTLEAYCSVVSLWTFVHWLLSFYLPETEDFLSYPPQLWVLYLPLFSYKRFGLYICSSITFISLNFRGQMLYSMPPPPTLPNSICLQLSTNTSFVNWYEVWDAVQSYLNIEIRCESLHTLLYCIHINTLLSSVFYTFWD